MIERVNEHIIEKLKQNTRTGTVFIVAAILLDLLILAINSGMAAESRKNPAYFVVPLSIR